MSDKINILNWNGEYPKKDNDKLLFMHKLLRRAKYFYYEFSKGESISVMSDYQFDIMEKEYVKLCDKYNVEKEKRVTEFIGWNIGIPMNLEL